MSRWPPAPTSSRTGTIAAFAGTASQAIGGLVDPGALPRPDERRRAGRRGGLPDDPARPARDRRRRVPARSRASRTTASASTSWAAWADGVNITLGSTIGTQIGTAPGQKLGFFGKTPTTQPTMGAATAGATYTSNEQAMLQAVYNAVRTLGLGS